MFCRQALSPLTIMQISINLYVDHTTQALQAKYALTLNSDRVMGADQKAKVAERVGEASRFRAFNNYKVLRVSPFW